jgi:tetratricopeptide (TPR) repeat protein
MILVTSRPDHDGGSWDFRFHVQRHYPHRMTELTLPPLVPQDSQRLVENLLHLAEIPEAIRGRILDQSEGNPFFVEELIRTLIEEGALRRDGERWVAPGEVSRIAIPPTLRGLIAARIDRLPAAAKAALQRAAVIGRFVSYRALQALYDGHDDLDRSIAQLLRADLLREWSHVPERQYVFKHALTQEAAASSILLDERHVLNRRLALFFEQEATPAAGRAALLAHHWRLAEDWDKALTYTLEAAERARTLYARPEAIAHYWQALDVLDRLPSTPHRERVHIDTLVALASQPGWRRNADEQEAGLQHLERALTAAARLEDDARLVKVETLLGWHRQDEEALRRAHDRAKTSDESVQAFANLYYGGYLGQVGRYESSLLHIDLAIEVLGTRGETSVQGYEMASGGRCYSARAGRLAEALDYAARARELGDRLDDPRLRAWRAAEAEPYMYKGSWEDAVRVAEENLPHCWEIREWGPAFWVSGWAAIAALKLGRHDVARRLLERALPECEALGASQVWGMVWLQMALAQLSLALDDKPAALAAARRAAELAEKSHFRLEQGAAFRVLGQSYEASDEPSAADAAFRRSLDVLDAIQSRPELGQTLLAYGRFRGRTDRGAGQALIERALELFKAMDASGWIAEARQALATSAPSL